MALWGEERRRLVPGAISKDQATGLAMLEIGSEVAGVRHHLAPGSARIPGRSMSSPVIRQCRMSGRIPRRRSSGNAMTRTMALSGRGVDGNCSAGATRRKPMGMRMWDRSAGCR